MLGCSTLALPGCMKRDPTKPRGKQESGFDLGNATTKPSSTSLLGGDIRLNLASQRLGVEQTYHNGEQGRALLVETIGGGIGWLDFNNDGWPDLYCTQGGDPTREPVVGDPSDALLRNSQGHQFADCSGASRIHEIQYSQGIAIADFDSDGFDDIYVTNVGPNSLFWNCGDGTFSESTDRFGVQDARWSSSAAWADLNRDGLLDLYVCNYCEYDPRNAPECKDATGTDSICNPADLSPAPDECFINTGLGFTRSAETLGLTGPDNRALGVAIADFTGDDWPDIYIANDTTANFLFVSGDGEHFTESASSLGCAVDRTGTPQGSMGIAVADFDGNALLDIYCTNYEEESNTLYLNLGPQGFSDRTALAGLHRPTVPLLGFGSVCTDLNSDGSPELFVANGHVNNATNAVPPQMPAQLLSRQPNGRWSEASSTAGEYFTEKHLGRGVAIADFDNDGDQDIAVANQNSRVAILENETEQGNWLTIELIGIQSNRSGLGTRVTVNSPSGRTTQELYGGGSFASTSTRQLRFGLGDSKAVTVELQWPSGTRQNISLSNSAKKIVVVEASPTTTRK